MSVRAALTPNVAPLLSGNVAKTNRMQLKAKGLQNFASVVGGAAVFSSLAQLPEPYQSFTSEISLSIG